MISIKESTFLSWMPLVEVAFLVIFSNLAFKTGIRKILKRKRNDKEARVWAGIY